MIEFSNEEKEIIVTKIQAYFNAELNQEIGQFDAEFLMDFLRKRLAFCFITAGSMMPRPFWKAGWIILQKPSLNLKCR